MAFNFKKNFLIIMLLIIVILSTIVYINIQNIKESFISNRIDPNNIIPESSDASYNYYKLNHGINGAYNYYIKNIPMDSTNVYSSLTLVATVQKTAFMNGINTSTKNYFRTNKALIGYCKDASSVQLYNVKPSIILDISAVVKSTSSSDISSVYMLFIENSGNLYDLSNTKLSNFYMKINGVDIIKSGVFQKIETKEPPTIIESSTNVTPTSAASASIGDINFSGLFGTNSGLSGISNELFLYLLNQGTFGSSYVPPIYNNFETAMNLSSNPLVNPVNSMNPLEYAQTLFGPQVTPMMSKNSALNSDTVIDSSKDSANTKDSVNTKGSAKSNTNSSLKDMFKFDADGNLLSQNIGNKKGDNASNTSNCTKVNVDEKLLKEKCAPCPAPQRCPESNFECKKVPNYEQGINNAFLPRPVLADFSTFGT